MAAAVGALDDMIKEYLLYRGFTQTLKLFEQEKKDDKDKGFRVNRIVDYLMQCVNRSDFASLQTFWMHLNKRFFSRLTHESLMTAYRLESNILKLYLAQASKQGRQEEVRAFFEKMSDALHDRREWKDWFVLPFTKNPEQHPAFKLYYSKEYLDTFIVTLHNFFSTLFTILPLPALLNFEAEHQKMQALATENHHLHNQLATTKTALAEAETLVQNLDSKLAWQIANQATATKRRYSGGKPVSKLPVASPKKKTSSFSTTSPVKVKKMVKSASDEKPDKVFSLSIAPAPQKEGKELEQTPPPSPRKHKSLTLEEINDSEEGEADQLTSPASVVDEGGVRTHMDTDGNPPFLPVNQETYSGHAAPITHCKFSPNATRVATVDTDGVMRIWEPSTLVTSSTVELRSSLLSLDWVPQSDSLVLIGSSDGVVKLFDSSTSKYHWEVSSDSKYPRVLSIVCSPSSSMFAFSAAASSSTTTHTSLGSRLTLGLTSPSLPSHRAVQTSSELNKVGDSREFPLPGGVFIWDLKTQKQKCSLPITPLPVGVNCMAFNHNSNLLVTGATDGMIRLYDVFQQECLFGWGAHEGEVYNVQFSSDETSVYSMGKDRKFCQWSVNKSGEKITDFKIHKDACLPTVGWSQSPGGQYCPPTPRGNLFAFESEDKFVLTCALQQALVYQVGSEGSLTKILSILGHGGPVTCVDWLQGRRSFSTCVTGSMDCTIKVSNLLKNVQDQH